MLFVVAGRPGQAAEKNPAAPFSPLNFFLILLHLLPLHLFLLAKDGMKPMHAGSQLKEISASAAAVSSSSSSSPLLRHPTGQFETNYASPRNMHALAALPSCPRLQPALTLDLMRTTTTTTGWCGGRPAPCLPCNRRSPSSLHVALCRRPSDHEVGAGDADDVFDDLFKKYGKVVYKSGDQKRPAAEADDDSESLSFAVTLAKVANEVKAADIRVLFVKPLVYWTRFFIIVTAFSRPQIDAIGSKIRDTAEKQFNKIASGDTKPNSWTLLDFGDVVVHIFLPQQRAYYNLEEFYGNATPIELPFDNQSPFRS
ncbi:unnamed protein product [Musa acuminata subsp. burmannicoides]